MREAYYAATRLKGILQIHSFVRFIGTTARDEGDLFCGCPGAAASAETEGEDDGKKRDGEFHIVRLVYARFPF